MATQKGFAFTAKGEVLIAQTSNSGTDMVAAFQAANDARAALIVALQDLPAEFEITEPVQVTRRVADGGSGAADPTPQTDGKGGGTGGGKAAKA